MRGAAGSSPALCSASSPRPPPPHSPSSDQVRSAAPWGLGRQGVRAEGNRSRDCRVSAVVPPLPPFRSSWLSAEDPPPTRLPLDAEPQRATGPTQGGRPPPRAGVSGQGHRGERAPRVVSRSSSVSRVSRLHGYHGRTYHGGGGGGGGKRGVLFNGQEGFPPSSTPAPPLSPSSSPSSTAPFPRPFFSRGGGDVERVRGGVGGSVEGPDVVVTFGSDARLLLRPRRLLPSVPLSSLPSPPPLGSRLLSCLASPRPSPRGRGRRRPLAPLVAPPPASPAPVALRAARPPSRRRSREERELREENVRGPSAHGRAPRTLTLARTHWRQHQHRRRRRWAWRDPRADEARKRTPSAPGPRWRPTERAAGAEVRAHGQD